MSATHLVIDYRPHRVDFRGLQVDNLLRNADASFCVSQAGDYAQLAHVFPLENVRVDMIPVRLRGLPGWGRVLGDAAAIWADDMARHQVRVCPAGRVVITAIAGCHVGTSLPGRRAAHWLTGSRGRKRRRHGARSCARDASVWTTHSRRRSRHGQLCQDPGHGDSQCHGQVRAACCTRELGSV